MTSVPFSRVPREECVVPGPLLTFTLSVVVYVFDSLESGTPSGAVDSLIYSALLYAVLPSYVYCIQPLVMMPVIREPVSRAPRTECSVPGPLLTFKTVGNDGMLRRLGRRECLKRVKIRCRLSV